MPPAPLALHLPPLYGKGVGCGDGRVAIAGDDGQVSVLQWRQQDKLYIRIASYEFCDPADGVVSAEECDSLPQGMARRATLLAKEQAAARKAPSIHGSGRVMAGTISTGTWQKKAVRRFGFP